MFSSLRHHFRSLGLPLMILLFAFTTFLLWMIQPSRFGIWSPRFVDALVLASAAAGVVISYRVFRRLTDKVEDQISVSEPITILMLTLTLLFAYAAFRNQSRLSAEQITTSEGISLSELEMNDENLRCIYDNFAHNDFRSCLRQLTSNPENWSKTQFYVEAVWWLLEKSEDDERAWGSVYSTSIEYWREFVEDDPVGIFSYYIVAFHGSASAAEEAMNRAGVFIPGYLDKYCAVHRALEFHGARPEVIVRCAPAPRVEARQSTR